jgi:hypothetical protein
MTAFTNLPFMVAGPYEVTIHLRMQFASFAFPTPGIETSSQVRFRHNSQPIFAEKLETSK